MPGRALTATALALAALACASPSEERTPPVIETEDVGPAGDAGLDLAGDEVGRRRGDDRGVLPSDFPAGLPLFEPYYVVDFGDADGGGRFVELAVSSPPETVLTDLRRRAAAAGWTVASPAAGSLAVERRGLGVRIRVDATGAGASIRVEW